MAFKDGTAQLPLDFTIIDGDLSPGALTHLNLLFGDFAAVNFVKDRYLLHSGNPNRLWFTEIAKDNNL